MTYLAFLSLNESTRTGLTQQSDSSEPAAVERVLGNPFHALLDHFPCARATPVRVRPSVSVKAASAEVAPIARAVCVCDPYLEIIFLLTAS
jgi:hypothetical protein